jgi:hypothetical protein
MVDPLLTMKYFAQVTAKKLSVRRSIKGALAVLQFKGKRKLLCE